MNFIDIHDINVVSSAIYFVLILWIIKGIFNKFSGEGMFLAISGSINSILFTAAFLASIHITTKILVFLGTAEHEQTWINILNFYIEGKEIILYVVFIPIITIALFALMEYIKSIFDKPLSIFSNFVCNMARSTGRIVKTFIGLIVEMPMAVMRLFLVVLIISIAVNYYPFGRLADDAASSNIYNYIYTYGTAPITSSTVGQSIPKIFQESVEVFSENLANNTVFENTDSIKYLGFLRFQYETKSNEEIVMKAKEIVGNEENDRKKAYLLYDWIGNNLSYDWEKYNNMVNNENGKDKFGAIHAFNTRKGVCEDYSDLYVAMARAVGLKVRIIVGQGYVNGQWGGHAWNEVYITDEEKWIPLDTTWAKAGQYFDNRNFYKDHIVEAVAGEW